MTDRTYTQEDMDAAIAAALEEAANAASLMADVWAKEGHYSMAESAFQVSDHIRNLRPDAAAILRQRDARVYQEALEAAGRTDLPNPYGEK